MEVLKKNDGVLTDMEVLDLLREKEQRLKVAFSNVQSHDYSYALQESGLIRSEVTKYLTQGTLKKMTQERLKDLFMALENRRYALSEAEMIQLGNHLPTYPVEVYLIIDNCAERFSEDEVDDIIEIIKRFTEL